MEPAEPVRATLADQPHWLTPVEQYAWRSVLTLRGPLMAELGRRLARNSGLSMADYDVLVVLTESPSGTMPVSELLAATLWEASRLSHQLTRMQQRGLVERRASLQDGRRSEVRLTDQGRRCIDAASPQHVQDVRDLLIDRLEPRHLEALAEIAAIVEGQDLRIGGGVPTGG